MDELTRLPVRALLDGYAAGTFSPRETVAAVARRIERVDADLKAFVATTLDEAVAAAAAAETRWRRGTPRPLEGMPFAAKDLFDTEGVPTTYGSPMFATHVPARDAEAVRLIRDAGGILVGKTSTHEFAWGVTGANGHFGTGRNPWRPEKVAGGSSAGSGAAVAADLVPLALGTDTGGSIRVPAAFCGVVGLKPTFGRVSTAGVFPLAPSLDHVGPLARTPADAGLAFAVLAGDGSTPAPSRGVAGQRVGVCADLVPVEPAPAVQRALEGLIGVLADLGAEIVECAFADAGSLRLVQATIQQAEALRAHRAAGLWPSRRSEYGEDVRARFAAAEDVGFDDYVAAAAAREQIRARFDTVFAAVDVLVTPVCPAPPPVWGSDEVEHLGALRPIRDVLLPFTTPQNLAGLPAVAVRAAFDEDGLPVGVQLTGARGAEATVLAAAQAFYEATPELQSSRPLP